MNLLVDLSDNFEENMNVKTMIHNVKTLYHFCKGLVSNIPTEQPC